MKKTGSNFICARLTTTYHKTITCFNKMIQPTVFAICKVTAPAQGAEIFSVVLLLLYAAPNPILCFDKPPDLDVSLSIERLLVEENKESVDCKKNV